MDQSYSESDRSMSPSRILEQLEILQALQLLQRNNLNKNRLNIQNTPETSSSATEVVSHFSGSTSYNTFRSLLQLTNENNNNEISRQNANPEDISQKINAADLVEGVAMLNLSQESELVVSSSVSGKSKLNTNTQSTSGSNLGPRNVSSRSRNSLTKKAIELDEMPILSPRKDFETLVLEKLGNENINHSATQTPSNTRAEPRKKSFLKRGEGMARYGVKKDDLVIQNLSTLPWRRRYPNSNKTRQLNTDKVDIQNDALSKKEKTTTVIYNRKVSPLKIESTTNYSKQLPHSAPTEKLTQPSITLTNPYTKSTVLFPNQTTKHTLHNNKGKTWGSILTKEQDEYLRKLKQSSYYKNFESPTKSVVSDMSGDDDFINLKRQREQAEQNMFDLLEQKATQENFNLDNSFLHRFLQHAQLENSGESTPVVLQKCLQQKPELRQIFPNVNTKETCNVSIQSDVETCCSDYTECSSESTCCSCNTVEESPNPNKNNKMIRPNLDGNKNVNKPIDEAVGCNSKPNTDKTNVQEGMIVDEKLKTNVAEMNANLLATSQILKDRLKELEDEIEMFRKENANLTKMREEVDSEKQKFFEEKSAFEQKFNEEKILSEYYLSEEKEKLVKQKKIYEKYIREVRGRLSKKERDEVVQLKNEIVTLKEDIRTKDAKSTCTIARLRNQLKLMEKDKKELQDEIEKLKKENRRMQHSNEMTRRLTNIKYLEQINKKLTTMTNPKSGVPVDSNIKYKAFEIERQTRNRTKGKSVSTMPRSKSVPNINVTSKYAKYFSQRDAFSQFDKNRDQHGQLSDKQTTDDEEYEIAEQSYAEENNNSNNTSFNQEDSAIIEEANNLEKLYQERFKADRESSAKLSIDSQSYNNYFLTKDNTNHRLGNSPIDEDKSPSHHVSKSSSSSRSPVSILTNKKPSPALSTSNRSFKPRTQSPEPTSISPHCPAQAISSAFSSQNSLTRTSLTPREIKKPDGSKELRFPNGNVKYISADGKYSKFVYYNGDVKENFYNEGRIKYFFAESKTFHTTYPDGLEVLEFPDGQTEKRYKDGSSEVRLPNGSVRYHDPKNQHVREEWRFPDGTRLTMAANGEQRVEFVNGQVEVHANDHKRREFPDGTVKLVYNDGTTETRYASGRVRVKDAHGNLIMDSAPR